MTYVQAVAAAVENSVWVKRRAWPYGDKVAYGSIGKLFIENEFGEREDYNASNADLVATDWEVTINA